MLSARHWWNINLGFGSFLQNRVFVIVQWSVHPERLPDDGILIVAPEEPGLVCQPIATRLERLLYLI